MAMHVLLYSIGKEEVLLQPVQFTVVPEQVKHGESHTEQTPPFTTSPPVQAATQVEVLASK